MREKEEEFQKAVAMEDGRKECTFRDEVHPSPRDCTRRGVRLLPVNWRSKASGAQYTVHFPEKGSILLDVIILEATGNPATEEETEKKKIS